MSQQPQLLFLESWLFPFTVAPKLIPCLLMGRFYVFHPLPFMEGHLFLHDPSAFFPLASTAGEQDHSPVIVALAQISTPHPPQPQGEISVLSPLLS